jgi:hypothetical protein
MKRIGTTLAILASSVLVSACTDDLPPSHAPPGGATSTAGGTDSTYDHPDDTMDPWTLLNRLTQEGPPSFTSHMHSCPKVLYKTLGNVMSGVGMNPANMTAVSAGDLYTNGENALGGPNYANRIRENVGLTTSGMSREFDIFAAGAPEVLAAFTAGTPIARCPGAKLFDTGGACLPEGITCLIGTPATSEHVNFCNLTVSSATDSATGQKLAVAAILAAAYTCE